MRQALQVTFDFGGGAFYLLFYLHQTLLRSHATSLYTRSSNLTKYLKFFFRDQSKQIVTNLTIIDEFITKQLQKVIYVVIQRTYKINKNYQLNTKEHQKIINVQLKMWQHFFISIIYFICNLSSRA